ncbi:MAG: tubulin-like doman-containing protein [Rikenellaceae bacterium]
MENHLIIGLGGTGGNILKAFRKRLFQETSSEDRSKMPLGFVYVDSSNELMKPNDQTWKVLGENAQLGRESFLFVRGAKLSDQLNNVDNYPGIKNWIGSKKIWSNIVGNVGDDGAAAQKRRLGRFLFSCAVNDYETVLKNQAKSIQQKSGNVDITFHIIAGLAGGTGSGSVVDAIAQTRKHFVPNINSGLNYKIIVYCLVPENTPLPNWDKGAYHANGYAALTELNALKVKQFIPHDVSGQTVRIDAEGTDMFNACFLFTNANENGKIVNTQTELPVIVSDIIHHYISIKSNNQEAMRSFLDCFSTENVDPKNEYDENAESTEDRIPVRSKIFKSFGIKRIINPEEEIKEYLTFSFAQQALNQFKYNNWSDDLGFRGEARNEDYHSMINNDSFLKKIYLTDAHLMLSLGILPSEIEQKWKTIKDDWDSIIPLLSQTAWSNNEAYALMELSKLCQDRFDKNFRKVGVVEFYKIKSKSKKDHATEIVQQIEKYLFTEWHSGVRSLYDIAKMCDTLSETVDANLASFNSKVVTKEKKLEDLLQIKAQNEQEWAGTGVVSKLFGKKKNIFQDHTTLLQAIFTLKTDLVAMDFAKELLREVCIKVGELTQTVAKMVERFSNAMDFVETCLAIRCVESADKEVDYKDAIMKYYNPTQVRSFANQLIRDTDVQKKQATNVRNRVVELCLNELTFGKLMESMSEDTLFSILEQECMSAAAMAHDEYTTDSTAIIGKNIIEQLYEKYGSNDQSEALNDFARNIINASGVFLTFDNSEINRSIANNDAPRPNTNIMFRTVLISMPSAPGKEQFVEKLKAAFQSNVDGSKHLVFDDSSDKTNEITILSLTYCFPLRMVNDVKFLKNKYIKMLEGDNKEVNQLVLHLEGDGSQYPTIFVEPFNVAAHKELLLMGVALDLIKYQDKQDGTGRMAYCIIKEDDLGLPMPPIVISDKLSTMEDSETLKIGDIKRIKADIDALMQSEYLHVTKREELAKKVASLAKMILEECNNNLQSQVYAKYHKIISTIVTDLKK